MHDLQHLLVQLLVIFVAAHVGSEIAVRLKMPSVVGEILGGVAIGPHVFALVPVTGGQAPIPFEMLAEVGVVFLMFHVGLETQLSSLKRIGRIATVVAVLGVIVPFLFGMGWAWQAGFTLEKQAFVGTAFVATSVAITARVLSDLNALQRKESRIILAAAVLDDILAMLLLGTVAALQSGAQNGASTAIALLLLGIQALLFLLALTVFLPRLVRKHHTVMDAPAHRNSPFILAIAMCLALSVLAMQIGLAAIIGAFLAGTLLAEIGERYQLETQLRPLLLFFAAVVITVLAFAGKVIGCGLASRRLGKRSALIVGVGMSPRGEVGIIIAALGLKEGVFDENIYALIIAMSILTSIIAPPILAQLMKRAPAEGANPRAV